MRSFYIGYSEEVAERFAEIARSRGADASVRTEFDGRNEFRGYRVTACNHGDLDDLADLLNEPPFLTGAGTRSNRPQEQLAALDAADSGLVLHAHPT